MNYYKERIQIPPKVRWKKREKVWTFPWKRFWI